MYPLQVHHHPHAPLTAVPSKPCVTEALRCNAVAMGGALRRIEVQHLGAIQGVGGACDTHTTPEEEGEQGPRETAMRGPQCPAQCHTEPRYSHASIIRSGNQLLIGEKEDLGKWGRFGCQLGSAGDQLGSVGGQLGVG